MNHDKIKLLTTLLFASVIVVGAERLANYLLGKPTAPTDQWRGSAGDVVVIANDPSIAPSLKSAQPTLLLIGNSHTYAMPGLRPGDQLRDPGSEMLICQFARRLGNETPSDAQFALLAYPNFLPFEMLARVGQLLEQNINLKVVVFGLTWRNIARDTQPRHQVRQVFRDHLLTKHFLTALEDPIIRAAPDVIDAVKSEQRRVASAELAERMRSDSDRFDEQLTAELAKEISLVGRSAELRAWLFRLLTDWAQTRFEKQESVEYAYDFVEHDYAFNFDCLSALMRLLKKKDVAIVCYFAPERSDLPPLMEPSKQQEFIERFSKLAEELQIKVVDARGVVPNQYWGWGGEIPDRSHFTEPGHELLGKFLLEAEVCRDLWPLLTTPTEASQP